MSYTVYSRVGNKYYIFDNSTTADEFYEEFPGDAILLEGATVLKDKKTIKSFSDIIETAIYIQHKILTRIERADLLYYERVREFLKQNNIGLLLTGSVGVGKGTLMKTLSMCAVSGIIKAIPYYQVIDLRDVFILFQEIRHKAFEDLGIGSKDAKCMCIDNIKEEYLWIKNFGNTINVLGELIEERYAIFEKYGIYTHFVTSMNNEQLHRSLGESRYHLLLRMISEINMQGAPKNI